MQIHYSDVIASCHLMVSPNKGITLEEQILLKKLPPITNVGNFKNSTELVSLAIKIIKSELGRSNITPRDLKKAVVNLIEV